MIVTALSSTHQIEVHDQALEAILLSYVILCVATAAGTFLPLLSRGVPIIRRSEVSVILAAETRKKWQKVLVYVSASMMIAVVSWGVCSSGNSMYPKNSTPALILRMDVVGLYQFTVMSLLIMGADAIGFHPLLWWQRRNHVEDPDSRPLFSSRPYKTGLVL